MITTNLQSRSPLLQNTVNSLKKHEDKFGNVRKRPLISSRLEKSNSPQMYFLAMFNKKDIEKINGWDEEFMKGYAYEDCDFGARFVRANIPFVVRDDIQGIHQYHPRQETIPGGGQINLKRFMENNKAGIIKCRNGLNPVRGKRRSSKLLY